MNLPSPENWDSNATERIMKQISFYKARHKKHTVLDQEGKETNAIAMQFANDMIRLWSLIPDDHKPEERPF